MFCPYSNIVILTVCLNPNNVKRYCGISLNIIARKRIFLGQRIKSFFYHSFYNWYQVKRSFNDESTVTSSSSCIILQIVWFLPLNTYHQNTKVASRQTVLPKTYFGFDDGKKSEPRYTELTIAVQKFVSMRTKTLSNIVF